MTMTPPIRKLTLTIHIISSIGWLGAVTCYLVLAVAGLTSRDAQMVRAVYLGSELIAWYVIVPSCFISLLTGLIVSLGSQWGLFRHYWVLAKFLLTVFATIVLLIKTQVISYMGVVATKMTLTSGDFHSLRSQLVVHAAGGLVVLLINTILSVYKPRRLTSYGRRKLHEQHNE